MTNWYTADLHFGHENVIKFCNRPFRSANHMDAVLMQNLWAMVGRKDALWIIGDFAHGPKAKDTTGCASCSTSCPVPKSILSSVTMISNRRRLCLGRASRIWLRCVTGHRTKRTRFATTR